MATFSTPISYRVGDISIDLTRRVLQRADGEEIHLKPKAFAILVHLLENRDRLVTRQELIETFWKDTAVTEDALTQCIVELRRALADTPRAPKYLKTVPRAGFRFIGEVEEIRSGGLIATEEVTTVEVREEFSDEAPVASLPGPPRRRGLAAAGMALLLLLTAGAAVWAWRSHSLPEPPLAPAGKRQIAVLRFANRTGQADLDWLSDGVPDMLATTLSRSRTLDVLSREQVLLWIRRSGSGGLPEVLEIARRSHAEAAVIGTFARLGDSIRVDARAYDGKTGALLAAESITADKPERILREVDFLGARLASRLALKPASEDRREPYSLMTNNLEAYRYYVLGLGKSEAMHIEEAIQLFQKALELDPGFAMAYARIGYAYAVNSTQLAEGRPYLEKAFQMSGKLGETERRHIVAWYAIANQDYPEAIRRYRELIAAYPVEAEAYYRLAVLMRGESRQEEAIDLLRQALSIDPDDPNFYNSLSANLSEIGSHAEAIEMAQRYLALAPSDANAYDTLGLALRIAGRYEEAEAAFDKALQVKPDFEIAAIHRAVLYMQMGREKEGMAEFRRRAVGAGSPTFRARYWSGAAWYAWRRGQVEQARTDILEAKHATLELVRWSPAVLLLPSDGVPLTPDAAPIPGRGGRYGIRMQYFYLAQEARMKGRTADMLADLREALRYRTALADPEPLEDALADGYLEAGKVDEAIAEYERALKVLPGMAMARYHLAQAYRRKARTAEGKAEFQRFLEVWAHADADLPEVIEARLAADGRK